MVMSSPLAAEMFSAEPATLRLMPRFGAMLSEGEVSMANAQAEGRCCVLEKKRRKEEVNAFLSDISTIDTRVYCTEQSYQFTIVSTIVRCFPIVEGWIILVTGRSFIRRAQG